MQQNDGTLPPAAQAAGPTGRPTPPVTRCRRTRRRPGTDGWTACLSGVGRCSVSRALQLQSSLCRVPTAAVDVMAYSCSHPYAESLLQL